MKASAPILFFAGLASAWRLEVWSNNNEHLNMHGTTNSGCINFDVGALNINHAKFTESTFADTFELYQNRNCDVLKYRNGGGDYTFNVKTIRSYKVY
ncbi:hypothetical protein B0H67DRAFT_475604 [Lasiosphaeris hirsuta]|uniref:Uncharacterized protein n=1 Tax=Lasiosphaeris hirsuta TaxID=260670 RepID=A0AA40BD89_9PEZI|nr:hypothetical protein B0H67DRAFT_475604 [Lasiosphaeris hirsuta]